MFISILYNQFVVISYLLVVNKKPGFPLENLEKWEGIFQSGNSQGKSHKILENSGNFRKLLFVIF